MLALLVGFCGDEVIFQPSNNNFTFFICLPVVAGLGYGLSSAPLRLMPDDVPRAAIQIKQQFTTFVLALVC